jgi:hypothetical protein
MVVRRRLTKDKEPKWVRLEIQSCTIQGTLDQICGQSQWLLSRARPIVIYKPYRVLFLYRKEIREFCTSKDREKNERQHLNLLVTFIDDNFCGIT